MKPFVLIGALMCAAADVHAQRPAQPNVLLVYADDLGWQDPKVYDNEEVRSTRRRAARAFRSSLSARGFPRIVSAMS